MKTPPGRKPLSAMLTGTPAPRREALAPSVHLGEAAKSVWTRMVSDPAAGAFGESDRPMLEAFCQSAVLAQVLASEIASFDREWLRDEDGLKRYDTLLRMRERETRLASSLATRLRLTPQTMTRAETAGRARRNMPRAPKPWGLPDRRP